MMASARQALQQVNSIDWLISVDEYRIADHVLNVDSIVEGGSASANCNQSGHLPNTGQPVRLPTMLFLSNYMLIRRSLVAGT